MEGDAFSCFFFRSLARAARLSTRTLSPLSSLPSRHSLHAIAAQLSPRPGCTGIDHVAADTFDLHCFQALTGTKFLAVVAPGTTGVPGFLSGTVYSLYCDFVLKNPFYEAEMPVRCDAFDAGLAGAVAGVAKKWAAGG